MRDILELLGRIFISFIFLYQAYVYIDDFGATREAMLDYGITWQQNFWLVSAIFVQIIGGILILIGYRISFGAVLLLLYWVPFTFVVHSFWNDDLAHRQLESVHFIKNLSIIGGLLMVLVNGSKGKYSVRRLFATARVPGV